MKSLLIAIALGFSFSALATEQNFIARGKVLLITKYFSPFSGYFNEKNTSGKATLYANAYAEGKIKGKLLITFGTPCKGSVSVDFFGIDNGMGELDIYRNSNDLVSGRDKFGTYTDFGKEISFDLNSNLSFVGRHGGYDCSAHFNPQTGITLKK